MSRFVVWLITGFFAFSPARAKDLRESCQQLLFSGRTGLHLYLPMIGVKPGSRAVPLTKTAVTFLTEAKTFESIQSREALIKGMQPKWAPLFRARLQDLGYYVTEYTNKYDEIVFVLNREEIVRKNPKLFQLVPRSVQLTLNPFAYIARGEEGSFHASKREMALPISILDQGFEYEDLMTIVHESVHMRLEDLRKSQNHRRFAYQFEAFQEPWEEIYKLLGRHYADRFTNEEALAYLVDALNALEYQCVFKDKQLKISGHFLLKFSRKFINAYRKVVVPTMLEKLHNPNIHQMREGVSYATEGTSIQAYYFSTSIETFSRANEEKQFYSDMRADSAIFDKLSELLLDLESRVASNPERGACGRTLPLWDFLATQGLDPAIFRLQR